MNSPWVGVSSVVGIGVLIGEETTGSLNSLIRSFSSLGRALENIGSSVLKEIRQQNTLYNLDREIVGFEHEFATILKFNSTINVGSVGN